MYRAGYASVAGTPGVKVVPRRRATGRQRDGWGETAKGTAVSPLSIFTGDVVEKRVQPWEMS